MVEAQNKVVSIETFRAARTADRAAGATHRGTSGVRPHLSLRSVEHRERMLQFLRTEAIARREAMTQRQARSMEDGREVQARLLL